MKNILIVDDELTSQISLKKILEDTGYGVMAVSSGSEGLSKFKDIKFDVLITDLKMPDVDGIELTKEVLKRDRDIVVILITAYGSIRSAVEALRYGAYDYLPKPVDKNELLITIRRGLERVSLIKENELLKQELGKVEKTSEFLTENSKLKEVLHDARLVARSDSTVLITGEDGTGKEVLARYIHDNSLRKEHNFVSVNCSTIPKVLLESELFGHNKGSFKGAAEEHKGYFEIAEEGTIFLDEIGSIDPLLQIKLLNAIKEGKFTRRGSTKAQSTNARIIVSTKDDLAKKSERGEFNKDLYFKLNVFEFRIPSLKERPEDIIFYFRKFVDDFARLNNKAVKDISPEVKKLLVNYKWPWNVSELKNAAERVTILAKDKVITKDLLPDNISGSDEFKEMLPTKDFNKNKHALIKNFEMGFIKKYLRRNRGNVTATARDINFHPVTLRQKISKLGINPKEFKTL